MYTDKDRQREANRERQRRYKAKQKALPEQGVTAKEVTGIDKALLTVRDELKQESEFIKRLNKSGGLLPPKRGKDIKIFADLPLDVRQTIDRISDGSVEEKRKRTAIAISYQHTFPDRFYSTGIA